jgi:general secretion pathway protein E
MHNHPMSVSTRQNTLPPSNREQDFLTFLMLKGDLDAAASTRVSATMKSSAQSADTVMLELGLIPEARLAELLSEFCGYLRIYAPDLPSELWPDLQLPESFIRNSGLLVIDVNHQTVTVATSRPLQTDQIKALGYFLDREPVVKIAEQTVLANHLARLLAAEQSPAQSDSPVEGEAHDDDVERLRDVARNVPTIKLLNRLISTAVDQGASDIHLEPLEDQVRVRFRVDGVLQTAEVLPKDTQAGLTSRIKILARLNIAEQRLPQDGRIRVPVRGRDIDLRISTTPVLHGESVALRILDRQEIPLDLDALGFFPEDARRLQDLFRHPNGIVLVTGPTGSGKTTTLYAALNLLNNPDSKLFSVEDPVEYRLKGVNQIQVKPQIGLDFAAILRSVLRQDPDIIMIGEMRDLETARIAIQASLTGHFVLSTLHTNSAVAAITRLHDMGTEDYLLASCLRGVLSQRLVRKLCMTCKTTTKPDDVTKRMFQFDDNHHVYEPNGCSNCNNTGFRGRTVIYELLEITPEIRQAITDKAPEADILRQAKSSGMVQMHILARQKITSGTTSVDEVMRATSGISD